MRADLSLKEQQSIWETPRNIAILATAIAGIVGLVAGWLGYQIGRTPPTPTQIIFQPGALQVLPGAPAATRPASDPTQTH